MNNNTEELTLFSTNLKRIRELRGYSQQKVANIAGIRQQAYYRYESGSQTPSVLQAYKIAQVLDVKLDELLQPENNAALAEYTDPKIETLKNLQKLGFKIKPLKDNKIMIQPFCQNTSVVISSDNLIKAYNKAKELLKPVIRACISSKIQTMILDDINRQNGQ